jgi:trehalose 6-phosphate synthase/phosphatase
MTMDGGERIDEDHQQEFDVVNNNNNEDDYDYDDDDDLFPSIPVDGKVLRLHFACHAKLPMGSYLRVTSSQSWSSTSLKNNHSRNSSSNSSNILRSHNHTPNDIMKDDDLDDEHNSSLYSSSVEMVTSPEMYPIWKTRYPVIRVVNNGGGGGMRENEGEESNNESYENNGVLYHKYRYLVVTPGKTTTNNGDENDYSNEDYQDDDEQPKQGHQVISRGGMVTSDGKGAVIDVDEWENPLDDTATDSSTKTSVDDLPYRTVEIDVSSVSSPTFGKVLNQSSSTTSSTFTSDGVRIDNWNDATDAAFLPYKENIKANNTQPQQKQTGDSVWTSESDSDVLMNSDKDDKDKADDDDETNTKASSLSSSLKRIFLVCYHLPIILQRDDETGELSATFSESLIAKTEQSGVSKSYHTQWIGTVSSDFKTDEEKDAVRALLKPMNCTPLFLDKSLRDSFYYGMCKQVLWPAFHNIDLLDISKSGWGSKTMNDEPDASNWDQSRLDGWWKAYREVNKIFADTLMTLVQPNDKVWVHDYHLSLLPKMIHEAEDLNCMEQTIQMVYFLHIPFPTSQVFREIVHGEEILEGMLHADVVGFHAFDHARHFLTASKRILGLSHESLMGGLIGVRYRGTKVLVTISNVSIETDVVLSSMNLPSFTDSVKESKMKFEGKKVICGVDIAQGLSGVSLKLLAYERLLTDYPNWFGKVVLVQRNLIPSARISDEVDTLKHVRYLVNRLKKNFGPDVIDYEEINGSSLPRDQRLTLWASSDVFMSTCIREGLNLLPLEYVYVNRDPATPGVTLISEFSAMSHILNGALRVNPYDIKLASTIIDKALSMSLEEKLSRRERDIHFVSTSPSGQWTRNVLRDLNDVKLATEVEAKPTKKSLIASAKLESVRSHEEETKAALLNPKSVTSAYHLAKKRVIFIDFNGTIVMKEPTGKYLKREMLGMIGNKPPQETIEALTEICADENNVVFVVSGDTESNIENAIGDIPGLGLASGNGGCISLPLKPGESKRTWEVIDQGVNWEAVLNIAMPVLAKYTALSNGSFVKETSSSIGWSYYGCDPEWGEWLASYLVMELEVALQSFDIRIVKLKGVVEVVPRKLNKGRIVKRVLRDSGADFILCMGDDVSDEKMFTAVLSVLAESETEVHPSHAFTVTVGKKQSNASYYVENAEDVAELLVGITNLRRNSGYGRTMSWDKDDTIPAMFE